MAGNTTSSGGLLIDLPAMIQAVAGQRRSGVLVIGPTAETQRRLHFAAGQLVAVTGAGAPLFAKAVGWADVAPWTTLEPQLVQLAPEPPQVLASKLLELGILSQDALLDAVDCHCEEEFAVMLGWKEPKVVFLTDAGPTQDPWAKFQAELGVVINPGGMILECLRRQDELARAVGQVPDDWDVLVRVEHLEAPQDLSTDCRRMLDHIGTSLPLIDCRDHPRLTPFRAIHAQAELRRLGLLRLAGGPELVVLADAAFSRGNRRVALGLYQRAIACGQDGGRLHLHLAELHDHAGRAAEAAAEYLRAASGLNDHTATVVALRNALRLGGDPEAPLKGLAAIYTSANEREDAVGVWLELARHYEGKREFEQAVQAVNEAHEHGADPALTATVLARLAAAQGDRDQAAVQLEIAARAHRELGRPGDAIKAYQSLLALDPSRCDHARTCAELLVAEQRGTEARSVLRAAIAAQRNRTTTRRSANSTERRTAAQGESADASLLATYELLGRLDPEDAAVNDWLAKSYQKRSDRDGAVRQLRLASQAQARSGDDSGLIRTYERMIDLGGAEVEILLALAELRLKLGQEGEAAARWAQAVEALIAAGDLPRARTVLEAALVRVPAQITLRVRLAALAHRVGDRAATLREYRNAADLALGMCDEEAARDLLIQICRLRPDDLETRVRLARLLERNPGPEYDRLLRNVVQVAMQTNNHGIALEHARKRILGADGLAYEQRSELVALFNRIGDEVGELSHGRVLLEDLLEHGEIERAFELLQRLVASQPGNPDLVLQLADLHEALGDTRQSVRFLSHAVPLFQIEDRLGEARLQLDRIGALSGAPEDPVLASARNRLDHGQAIDWDKIRQEIEHSERRRVAEQIGTSTQRHEAGGHVSTGSRRAVPKQVAG